MTPGGEGHGDDGGGWVLPMEVLDSPVEVAAIGIVKAPVIKRNDPPPPLEAQPGEALEVTIGAGPRHTVQHYDDGRGISYATAAATTATTALLLLYDVLLYCVARLNISSEADAVSSV